MSGFFCRPISATINSVSGKDIVVTSSAGFYVGAKGWLNKSAQPNQAIEIVSVTSTNIRVRFLYDMGTPGVYPSTGYSDPTNYSGGTILQEYGYISTTGWPNAPTNPF